MATNEHICTATASEVKDGLWLVNVSNFVLRCVNRATFNCRQIDFAIEFKVRMGIQYLSIAQHGKLQSVSIGPIFNGEKPLKETLRDFSHQHFIWKQKDLEHCSLQLVIEFIDVIAEGQRNILTHLSNLFENKTMADVRFIVKDEEMTAHVGVLATSSPVMAAMLADDRFIEGQTKEVRIEDMEPQVFKEMLRYLYTGEVKQLDNGDMVELLFAAADRFQIAALRAICVRKMIKQLNLENCIRYLVMAHFHSDRDLRGASLQCLEVNKTRVWGRPDWQALGHNYPDLFFRAFHRMVVPRKDQLSKDLIALRRSLYRAPPMQESWHVDELNLIADDSPF